MDKDFIIAGQAVGGLREIVPAAEKVARMMAELTAALDQLTAIYAPAAAAAARL